MVRMNDENAKAVDPVKEIKDAATDAADPQAQGAAHLEQLMNHVMSSIQSNPVLNASMAELTTKMDAETVAIIVSLIANISAVTAYSFVSDYSVCVSKQFDEFGNYVGEVLGAIAGANPENNTTPENPEKHVDDCFSGK